MQNVTSDTFGVIAVSLVVIVSVTLVSIAIHRFFEALLALIKDDDE